DDLPRLGDLAHVLDALDTAAQIAQAGHRASAFGTAPHGADGQAQGHPANVFLNSSTAERSDASVSSAMRPLVEITSSMSGCVDSMKRKRLFSKSRTRSSGTSSRKPRAPAK